MERTLPVSTWEAAETRGHERLSITDCDGESPMSETPYPAPAQAGPKATRPDGGLHEPAVRSGNIAMTTVFRPTPGESQTSRKPMRHLPGRAVLVAIPLLCTLLLSAGVALAREAPAPSETPARIDNIWGGLDHQPTEFQVQRAERASGVAPSPQEQRREARIVQQLDQELLKSAGAGRIGAVAG